MDAAEPLRPLDRLLGGLFLFTWRGVGLLALPLLGLLPHTRRHVWRVPAPPPGRVWLHGASAGEHRAVAALRAVLDGVWPTSSSWRTPVPTALPAPLDLPFVVERWLDRARPRLLVLVESELWPGWLSGCRRRGIPVVVVNARDGRGTARWPAPLRRWLLHGVTVLPQAETGDLKLAAPARDGPRIPGPLLVGASTRDGDEARLLAAWQALPAPRPRLVLAPRHAARFDGVARLVDDAGVTWERRSTKGALDAEVVLLDTVGELAGVVAQAEAAFIGGTFDPRLGGHSPAEATAAGVPVVHGPETGANPAAWATSRAFPATEATLAAAVAAALAAGRGAPVTSRAAVTVAARLPAGRTPPETPTRPLLRPLVPVVAAIGARRPAWRGRVERAPLPVVSVGGLTAGGSGKTPVAAWLAAQVPGAWVVGRGYRRQGGGDDVRLGLPGEAPTRPLGDELEMMRRRGIPVVSAPDRVAGARAALAHGARLVVLDDGFQHRRLARDLDIVCLDQRWPTGRGRIPVGTGREGIGALSRADWFWLHHADGPPLPFALPQARVVRSRFVPRAWRTPAGELPLDAVRGPAPVVTGIARPSGFLGTLVDLGVAFDTIDLRRDHAALGRLPPGAVVTEKDAARLPPDADVRVLLGELVVEGADPLLAAVRALVEAAP